MSELLEKYPIITNVTVAWGEMDALQHVNNVVYFRYFETARLEYFNRIKLSVNLKSSLIGPVLGHTECRYKLPITYPDTLTIGARIVDLQDDRFTMEYQIVSTKLNQVSTIGKATCVMFDFEKNTKTSLPEEVRKAIITLENIDI